MTERGGITSLIIALLGIAAVIVVFIWVGNSIGEERTTNDKNTGIELVVDPSTSKSHPCPNAPTLTCRHFRELSQ